MAGENGNSVDTRLTESDVTEIGRRLCQVIDSERAIHKLAILAIDDREGTEAMLLAIREMARANVKGLDACTMRLSGSKFGAGNFAGEFVTE